MRYVRYLLLAVILVFVVLLALANRGFVTLRLMPDALGGLFQRSVEMPLFLVILLALLLGVALGYVLEWGREMRQRREAAQARRRIQELERELAELRSQRGEVKDEVLALLE
ncbi:MAG: DUF1049 domain-containing protein [Alphaproteobacteria bacterium]|nr:MAG: DUF1049 domain-containing protein [Alphaproteobacteria bacterium]